ncbi:hypothetical protein EV363DRAFT_1166014, partial [Boletus edulis]
TAGGDRATWAVDSFFDREAMDLHLKGQLDRTILCRDPERLSRSACNRNCANGKPYLLCRLNQVFSRRRKKMFVTKVHSTYASIGLGGKGSATSGKRVSDDITLNSHPDVAAFQLIRQVTPASV